MEFQENIIKKEWKKKWKRDSARKIKNRKKGERKTVEERKKENTQCSFHYIEIKINFDYQNWYFSQHWLA